MDIINDQLQGKTDILKKRGVVLTTPRLIILNYLLKNRTHPTADDIFKALKREFPSIAQASVYNTLKLFTKLGVVTELCIERENARYDINTTPHAHFKCLSCGRIFDLSDVPIAQLTKYVKGHKVISTQVYFYGICEECLKAQN